MNSVLILDTETTDRDNPEVIEAAWIRISGPDPAIPTPLEAREHFAQRYRPARPVTMGSLAVHHILPSELEGCAPSSSFALPAATAFVVGHSVDYDWQAIGSPPGVKRIDTCAMAKSLWPQEDSHSQSALLYMLLGATAETRDMLHGAHGALVDARNNLVLLKKILESKPDITTWSALWAFSEAARVPTIMPLGRNRGASLSALESSEIGWYLERDFIDPYLRKAFEQEIERRGETTGDHEEELEDEIF